MPHLISQRDSHPVCDGENGIKKKTPSGSISALMRRQGRGVVGRGQGTQDYHTAFSKCKLWAIWTNGRLSTAHWIAYLVRYSHRVLPLQETTVLTLHTYPADRAVLRLHPRGRTCPWFRDQQPTDGGSLDFWKNKSGRFCRWQRAELDISPSTDLPASFIITYTLRKRRDLLEASMHSPNKRHFRLSFLENYR